MSHALFDRHSYYRRATRLSLWRDGGDDSVRSYFHARAYQEQRRLWVSEDGAAELPDLGLGDAVKAELNAFVAATKRPQEQLSMAALYQAAAASETRSQAPSKPSLLLADPVGEAFRSLTQPDEMSNAGGAYSAECIDTFRLNLGNLSPMRRAVVLLLDWDLFDRLADSLGRERPEDEGQVIEIARAMLEPKMLAASKEEAACRRAFNVSMALALAPGLERITTTEGSLQCEVSLPGSCPGLDNQTWIAVCVSPWQEKRDKG